MPQSGEIDWAKLRNRIASGPIFPLVKENKNNKTKRMTTEELEAFKKKEHDRQKEWREANPDKRRELQRDWSHRNPDKVKAKRKRHYDSHKDDPEWKKNKLERQKRYMENLKKDPVRYEEFKRKKRERNKKYKKSKVLNTV